MAPTALFAPALGFQDSQRWTWDFALADGSRHIMTDRADMRVREQSNRGEVVIEWAIAPISEVLDDQVLPLPAALPPLRLRETRARDGHMVDRDEHPIDGPWAWRYARLWALQLPAEGELTVDANWTSLENAPDQAVPPIRGSYRVIGVAPDDRGQPGWRIRWSRTETEGEQPISATGDTWVTGKGYWPWRIEAIVRNARVPGSESVLDADSGGATLTFTAVPWVKVVDTTPEPGPPNLIR